MLHVHRSERADGLVAMLAELLSEPLDDPLTPEIVAVPTRGVERWLSQQLSGHLGVGAGGHDGVCANIDCPFPGTVIGAALAVAGAVDPRHDPWSPDRSVWPLFEVVAESLDQPWLSPLRAHLGSDDADGGSRRFAAMRRIADLFDRYGVHRPEMVRGWLDGESDHPGDQWQPALWRQLRRRIGTPSPAERLAEALGRLADDPGLLDLPPRLSMFGLTRLPASYLDVLDVMAAHRDVHLFLLHPSPGLWDRVAGALDGPTRGVARAQDPTVGLAENPLLASWGRDAREMQLVMAGGPGPGIGHHRPVDGGPDDLLHRLQADVRADRAPPGSPLPGHADGRAALDPADRSVQVHACHGRSRQVEVVRDAVLHLLAEDPTLEPRDVIVMCPDIETFAPLVHATFDSDEADDEDRPRTLPDLRVRLADRSLRQTNPVLGVVAELLDLAASRLSATEVLDLAGREPVRRRFGFGDDDLTRVEEWVVAAGVRWGLDGTHRTPFKLGQLDDNTWHAGLDRALLGVAMAEDGPRLFASVLPLDDMGSGDIELAGRLAELVDRLAETVDALGRTQPVDDWARAIGRAADAFTATTEADAWQRIQLQRLLDDLVDEATTDGRVSPVGLSPADVRSLVADRLRGRPTRANFRTGSLTICTLVPMRSVPHRVVCLLGLDDGVFPRPVERDGDDLLATNPEVGDSDPRAEDRQLLLDALMAATERVVITYTARDERTNLARPPAVPLGELLDVIDATVRATDGRPARAHVTTTHPLQPFDLRNFSPGALRPSGPWSFDPVNRDGAKALAQPRLPARPWLDGPLDPIEQGPVELAQLERFVRHPVGAFLRLRLGVSLADRGRDVADDLPVELDGLEKWAVGDRLLAARLAGATAEAAVTAERARGQLPPGQLADPTLAEVMPTVDLLVTEGRHDAEPRSLDVFVPLADGTAVVGTVAGLRDELVHTVTYSALRPGQRLIAWLRLLALSAAWPDTPWRSVTVGRGPKTKGRPTVAVASVGPLGRGPAERRAAAVAQLEILVDLFRRGMGEPLPLYQETSAAWARTEADRRTQEATGRWESEWGMPKEDADQAHQLVLGGVLSFAEMVAASGRPRADETGTDETGAGWDEGEESRFGRYAHRLWDGLLAEEHLEQR